MQGNHPVQDSEEVEVVYVEPVEPPSTTTTTTTTKSPTVIILQQNPYPNPNPYPMYQPNSYYPRYQQNPPPAQYPPYMMMPNTPPTTTITTTTTTTTTTASTTTKKPRRKRKKKKPKPFSSGKITYQNMAPNVLIDGILPPEPPNRPPGPSLAQQLANNMITKRVGLSNSNRISHVVPPPISGRRFNGNWRKRRRLNNNQFNRNNNQFNRNNRFSNNGDPYMTGNSNNQFNRNNRFSNNGDPDMKGNSNNRPTGDRRFDPDFSNGGIQGQFENEFKNTFNNLPARPPRIQQNTPDIFSQGHPGDPMPFNPTLPEHTVFVNPPSTTTYKPPIRRPPPKHPGVRVPGVTHPPNSGSIQDIINTIQYEDPNRRFTPVQHQSQPPYQGGYRPPIKKIPYGHGHSDYDTNYNFDSNTYNNSPPQPPKRPIEQYSSYQPEPPKPHIEQYSFPEPDFKPNFYESSVKVPNLTPEEPNYQYNSPSPPDNPYHPPYTPYQQPPSNPQTLPPVQQGHDHQQTHYYSNQRPPNTDTKGPDISDGQGVHYAQPGPAQTTSFNQPQPPSFNRPQPAQPPSFSPLQPTQSPPIHSPYNPPHDPYIPQKGPLNLPPPSGPPQPTQSPPIHSPYNPPHEPYNPPKGPLNLPPPSSYDLSKIDITKPQFTNDYGSSHFFNDANKMQHIELNENNTPQGDPNDYQFYSFNPNEHQFNSLNFAKPAQRPGYRLTTTPAPNYPNRYTSYGTNPPISHTFTRPPKDDYGSGMPTGIFDPTRPDGPDYSTNSKVNYNRNRKSPSSLPVNIGLDVYPLQGIQGGQTGGYSNRKHDDKHNLHQVKLHLNLFSSKPSKSKPSESFSIGPFGYNENG